MNGRARLSHPAPATELDQTKLYGFVVHSGVDTSTADPPAEFTESLWVCTTHSLAAFCCSRMALPFAETLVTASPRLGNVTGQ